MGGGSRVTVCIGDLHGHYLRALKLWANLEAALGEETFLECSVVFLGDFNDRGPDTKNVIEWLTQLPTRYPRQKHVFLAGNHDFSFAAFMGVLPPAPPGFDFASTWAPLEGRKDEEGWYSGPGHEHMHVQGRRWAGQMAHGNSTYDAASTFESYGVKLGDRDGLIAAVPEHHKKFVQNLAWVYEEEGHETGDPATSYRRLLAVHAGLEASATEPLERQLERLRARNVTVVRLEALSGRRNVWEEPQELAEEGVLLVSGHHGTLAFPSPLRMIIDESGGLSRPIAAIILPSRVIVRDTDEPVKAPSQEAPTPALAFAAAI